MDYCSDMTKIKYHLFKDGTLLATKSKDPVQDPETGKINVKIFSFDKENEQWVDVTDPKTREENTWELLMITEQMPEIITEKKLVEDCGGIALE